MISPERAFFNAQTDLIEKTYMYFYDGLHLYITLPKVPREDLIISSLLTSRPFILRIGILYEHRSSIKMYFESGLLITNRLVRTCAHHFDPIQWTHEMVPYRKIYISFHDPACGMLFSLINLNSSLIEAKTIRRGLEKDNMPDYDDLQSDTTNLALLSLNIEAPHVTSNEHFDPQLNSLSLKSNVNPINSKLFLIGYNGESTADDLKPYKNLQCFQYLTIHELNFYHNINSTSISIGHFIKEEDENNQYCLHNCRTLPNSSGSIILDCNGKLAGIHIGVSHSRKKRSEKIFFNEAINMFQSVCCSLVERKNVE